MASTPEGKVKSEVRKLLDCYHGLWYFMPVPSGYGRKTVDFLGCFRGSFFAIETKAEGKEPTKLQALELAAIKAAGGRTFVIIGEDDARPLYNWLETINGNVPYVHQSPAPEGGRPLPG